MIIAARKAAEKAGLVRAFSDIFRAPKRVAMRALIIHVCGHPPIATSMKRSFWPMAESVYSLYLKDCRGEIMKKKDCLRRNTVFCLVLVVLLALLLAGCGKTGSGKSLRTGTGPALQAQAGGFGGCGKKSGPDVQEEQADEQKDSADGQENTAPGGDQAPADAGDDSGSPAQTGTDPSADPAAASADQNTAADPSDATDAAPADQNTAAEPAANTGVESQARPLTAARQNLEITSQPVSTDVKEDETAVFKIGAKGDGLSYQWQCRESADKAWRKSLSPGSTESSLTVEGKKAHNGFQFRCVVADSSGTSIASDAATLYVFAITKHPTEENVKKGKTATFIAGAMGRDLSYEWQRCKPSEKEWKKYGSDNTSPTLKVRDTVTGWNGCKYRCKITDGSGHTSYTNPAVLYVLGVTHDPVDQSVRKGSAVSFRAAATGKSVRYEWQTKLPSEEEWSLSGGRGARSQVLTIDEIGLKSNGRRFRCKITDADGKSIHTDSAKVYVFGITSNPKTQYVKTGWNATFRVAASGKDLQYQWQRWSSSANEWKKASGSGSQSPVFTVENVSSGMSGTRYRCKVTDGDKRGTYSNSAALSVLSIVRNPSTQDVKTQSKAVFRVSARGMGLKYRWEVKESSSHNWRGSISSGNRTKTLTVSTLKSRSGYRFRCRVTDAKGNVVYSNPATLYVPGIVKNPSMQKIKAGQTAVFRVKATGRGLKYSWQVRENSNSGWRSSVSPGHTTNTLKVKGKTGHHGFKFRCKVTDSKGRVFYSTQATLFVLGITSQPQDAYEDVGHTAVFRVRATGSGVKYQWQYYASGSGWKNSAASGNRTSVLKVKATPGRDGYRFRCRLKDNKGNVIYTRTARLHVYNSELYFQNY